MQINDNLWIDPKRIISIEFVASIKNSNAVKILCEHNVSHFVEIETQDDYDELRDHIAFTMKRA